MTQLRAIVTGKVQGVSYRAWAVEQATELGLDGWVRNLPDRSVEIVVRGNSQRVAEFLDWCREGPIAARVAGLEADVDDTAIAKGFIVRR